MVEVTELKKIYKLSQKQMQKEKTKSSTKVAVNGISFTAVPGQIFGLLGPNGAGKTTTLRCIATLLKPTDGIIQVAGHDSVKDAVDVRRKICFLTNELKLDTHFTAQYTMEYFGAFYGLDMAYIQERTDMLFDKFGITEFRNRKIGEFSTGMKQKLSIAVSLVHDPEIVIFDEPINGLDIVTARSVTDFLKELKHQGKTVIVSTHIMVVAAKLCDQIGILINGELQVLGTHAEILEKTGSEDLEDTFFELYSRCNGGQEIC